MMMTGEWWLTFKELATGPPYLSLLPLAHKVFTLIIIYQLVTYHLDLVLSASQSHGSGTPCLSAIVNPSHFLLLNAI